MGQRVWSTFQELLARDVESALTGHFLSCSYVDVGGRSGVRWPAVAGEREKRVLVYGHFRPIPKVPPRNFSAGGYCPRKNAP